jgi:hypothetical protein
VADSPGTPKRRAASADAGNEQSQADEKDIDLGLLAARLAAIIAQSLPFYDLSYYDSPKCIKEKVPVHEWVRLRFGRCPEDAMNFCRPLLRKRGNRPCRRTPPISLIKSRRLMRLSL